MTTVADGESARRLGDVLRAAGYGPDALRAALDASASAAGRTAPSPRDAPVLRRRLRDDGPGATLLRLFLLGVEVPFESAQRALAPVAVDELVAATILLVDGGGGVRSAIRIGWCDDILVPCDWEHAGASDHVAGVSPASLTLADLTVREAGVAALDIGTGGGVQALLAARHARSVVGTDVNRRALALARTAGALNGIGHADWRHGSLFEPVAGERYDLVTANPPFVISPDLAYVFRDGGGDGDSISRQVVAGTAAALNPGGWGTVLCNWVDPPGPDWAEPVRGWLAGADCDAWVLRYRTDDPVSYAALWNTQAGRLDERSMEEALDRWVAYYERLGIGAVVTGAVVLHRPCEGAGQRVWADDMTAGPDGPAGEQIMRVFAHRVRLHTEAPRADDLLDAVLVPVDGVALEQTLTRRAGRYEPAALSVQQRPGLGIAVDLPADVVPVLLALDGRRTLRDVIADVVAESETDAATEFVLPTARRLLELGLVEWRPATAP